MDLIERIKKLSDVEGLTREDLCEKTGIKYTRLQNIMNKRGRVGAEEVQKIGEAFPEYRLWIAYGDEMPEAGQVSPMTKKVQKDYKTTG